MARNYKNKGEDGAVDTIGNGLRVVILEDDPDQSAIISLWLKDAGYSVNVQAESSGFIRAIRRDSFDIYLLDWIVPELTGIEVLRKLRNEIGDNTPVIVATVKDKERDVVRALEAGADDYIVKPMKQGELLARVAAVLRRSGFGTSSNDTFDVSPYVLDIGKQLLSLDGEEISLTNREFELAVLLFRNAGKLLSRGHILEAIWGIDNDSVSTRTVDTHVSRLRKKLNLNEDNGWKLTAVYQHGYRIERNN